MVLGGAIGSIAVRLGHAAPVTRLAVLDWGIAETLIAIGHPPIALAEVAGYDAAVVEPAAPDGVRDLGLRLSPSAEMLALLRPDRILINPAQAFLSSELRRLAPVIAVPVYVPNGHPFERARGAARQLGAMIGDPGAGEMLIAKTDREIATERERIAADTRRSVVVGQLLDADTAELYGNNSLLDGVLRALDLRNGFDRPGSVWGTTHVGLDRLAGLSGATLVLLGPLPSDIRPVLRSPLWRVLPAVADGRVRLLPPVWTTGGLASAARFARLLVDALLRPMETFPL